MDLYDLRQNHRIRQSEKDNRENARKLTESQESTEELKQSVQRLSLICHAMWNLIQEKTDLTDDDLLESISQVEQQLSSAQDCPHCGRTQVRKHSSHCLYCGEALLEDKTATSFFKV